MVANLGARSARVVTRQAIHAGNLLVGVTGLERERPARTYARVTRRKYTRVRRQAICSAPPGLESAEHLRCSGLARAKEGPVRCTGARLRGPMVRALMGRERVVGQGVHVWLRARSASHRTWPPFEFTASQRPALNPAKAFHAPSLTPRGPANRQGQWDSAPPTVFEDAMKTKECWHTP